MTVRKYAVSAIAVLFGMNWLVSLAHAGVHPFHLSSAELELNAKTQRVEVALKIHGSDLERALTQRNDGKRVSIDGDEKVHPLIAAYLDEHFVLSAKAEGLLEINAQPSAEVAAAKKEKPHRAKGLSNVKVIGTEFRSNWLWVYFELELPSGLADSKSAGPWHLRNTLLLDVVDGQINTVSVRNMHGRYALRSSKRKPVLELPGEWLSPENAVQKAEQQAG